MDEQGAFEKWLRWSLVVPPAAGAKLEKKSKDLQKKEFCLALLFGWRRAEPASSKPSSSSKRSN